MAEQEARLIKPYQTGWDSKHGVKDFGPHPMKVENDPVEEVEVIEEELTPLPKDLSAPEPVISEDSTVPTVQQKLETPVQHLLPDQTENQQDADSENGKLNAMSEEDLKVEKEKTLQDLDSSSPSSSSETSPGKPMPPAQPKPPTSDTNPKQ